MRNIKIHTLLGILVLLILCGKGSAFELKDKLQSLITEHIPQASLGIIIQDPQTGTIIYEDRAHENFYPASNTKLFTAVAALKFFGPDFQFQTSVHAPLGKIKNGILNDDLHITFRGDPSFSINDLKLLFQQLPANGIKEIKGDILIDDQSFSDPPYAPGWTWDSIDWYYSAPITSIILNENKVKLKFHEAQSLLQPIKVECADNEIPFLNLHTNISAVSLQESEQYCQLLSAVTNNDITLKGCWPLEKTPTVIELAIDNPQALAQKLILQFLHEFHIKFHGTILFSKMPADLPMLLTKRSPPLQSLLTKVLADSNNIYTESLTKTLGLAYFGKGTFQSGIRAIQEILQQDLGLECSEMRISDGSGQSRYNLISPYLISQLLFHMYHDHQFEIFHSALSVSGKNGSLSLRLQGQDEIGKVVGKTGSAIGTSALSGYFTALSGKKYLFSVLINQSSKDYNALKKFEDTLCQTLITDASL